MTMLKGRMELLFVAPGGHVFIGEADENIWYLDKAEIGTGAVRIRLLTQEGYQ